MTDNAASSMLTQLPVNGRHLSTRHRSQLMANDYYNDKLLGPGDPPPLHLAQ